MQELGINSLAQNKSEDTLVKQRKLRLQVREWYATEYVLSFEFLLYMSRCFGYLHSLFFVFEYCL